MPYDPHKRNGWARGLIHFHTRFSDGWASVMRAGEIAVNEGYEFLIITDHLRNLKLFTHKTLEEYIAACDAATRRLGIPIIPGGEMEVHWNNPTTTDFSEAHTLALSIRDLAAAGEFDWTTPGTDPFEHWTDSQGGKGTILAVQEKLREHGLPPASHQFQHSDYRYDLARLPDSRYFDFFYSGTVDLIHEMEDILLVARHATVDPARMKGVYGSCDFHIGPETLRAIDLAITSSTDLQVTLSVFLDQVASQLAVDAAAILLLEPRSRLLHYAAGRGSVPRISPVPRCALVKIWPDGRRRNGGP